MKTCIPKLVSDWKSNRLRHALAAASLTFFGLSVGPSFSAPPPARAGVDLGALRARAANPSGMSPEQLKYLQQRVLQERATLDLLTTPWFLPESQPWERRYQVAAKDAQGRVYVLYGHPLGQHEISFASRPYSGWPVVERYDPRQNSWAEVSQIPQIAYDFDQQKQKIPFWSGMGAATDNRGFIYLMGGTSQAAPWANDAPSERSNVLASCMFRYDPTENTWQQAPSMPTPRTGLSAATDNKGRIYALGGTTSFVTSVSVQQSDTTINGMEVVQAAAEVYDPATQRWSSIAPMPTARKCLTATTDSQGRIYAIGGLNGTFSPLNTVERYDPATGEWNKLAPMPTARCALAAVLGSDGRIYAIGGYVPNKAAGSFGRFLAVVEAYDPKSGKWTTERPLSGQRYGVSAVSMPDGNLMVIGGLHEPSEPMTEIYSLNR